MSQVVEFSESEKYKKLANALSRITESLDADRSTLFVVDKEANELVANIAEGLENHVVHVNIGEGVAGHCAAEKRIVNVANSSEHEKWTNKVDDATGYKTKTLLTIPLFSNVNDGEVMGVIEVLNKRDGAFSADDEEVLTMFAKAITLVIENVLV